MVPMEPLAKTTVEVVDLLFRGRLDMRMLGQEIVEKGGPTLLRPNNTKLGMVRVSGRMGLVSSDLRTETSRRAGARGASRVTPLVRPKGRSYVSGQLNHRVEP
jgi:hypothetical protein